MVENEKDLRMEAYAAHLQPDEVIITTARLDKIPSLPDSGPTVYEHARDMRSDSESKYRGVNAIIVAFDDYGIAIPGSGTVVGKLKPVQGQ